MYDGRNPETLAETLDEIIYEYNLGYEPVHEEALRRAIELIKQHDLDEKWTENNVKEYRQQRIDNDI